MSYTTIFGGTPVNPSGITLETYNFSSNANFTWPSDVNSTTVLAQLMRISTTTNNLQLHLPDATQGSTGYAFYVQNIGTHPFTITNQGGGTIASVGSGVTYLIYLLTNTTPNGVWSGFVIGSTVTQANAAALAGLGLIAINATLNTQLAATSLNTNYASNIGDRASVLLWTGGAGTITLPSPSVVGNGWFVAIKNNGTGTLTVNPHASETIDNTSSIQELLEESAMYMTDGTNWFTIGRGRLLNYSITRLVIGVPPSGTLTLSSTQAQNQVLAFTGALTGNLAVQVPTTIQVYYVTNNTTGAFTFTFETTTGSGVTIASGQRAIVYSDGTNIVAAEGAGAGSVTEVDTGAGLTGGPITGIGTIALATTGVSPGTVGDAADVAQITFNAYGQATAIASVPILVETANIDVGAVTATNIAAGAVTAPALGVGAVTAPAIGAAAVTTTAIAANAVTNATLAQMNDATVKANMSGSTANPSDLGMSAILDHTYGSNQGQIIFRGASAYQGLNPGTSGQFLQSQGASANLQWATVTPVPTATPSAVSGSSFIIVVDFTTFSTYKLIVDLSNLVGGLTIEASSNAGGTYGFTAYTNMTLNPSSLPMNGSDLIDGGSAPAYAEMTISQPSVGGNIYFSSSAFTSTTVQVGGGTMTVTAAVNRIRLTSAGFTGFTILIPLGRR